MTSRPSVPPGPPCAGFVLVLAGGGYARRAEHEGQPVVERLRAHGIPAACLDYAVAPQTHPTALHQVLAAVADLRSGTTPSSDFQPRPVVTGPVAVLGFSAGAHLAGLAITATAPELARAATELGRPLGDLQRPDAAVLAYPVVSMTSLPHLGSRHNLLGEDADDTGLARSISVEQRVDASTPPVFAWHTADDTSVDVEHSLALVTALSRAHVPYELHVYPSGRHGLGLADGAGAPAGWFAACLRWLAQNGIGPAPREAS